MMVSIPSIIGILCGWSTPHKRHILWIRLCKMLIAKRSIVPGTISDGRRTLFARFHGSKIDFFTCTSTEHTQLLRIRFHVFWHFFLLLLAFHSGRSLLLLRLCSFFLLCSLFDSELVWVYALDRCVHHTAAEDSDHYTTRFGAVWRDPVSYFAAHWV